MFYFFLISIIISIILVMVETVYVFNRQTEKIHGYLLFYLICVLVNNTGYVFEMLAKSSASAYTATRFLYLGKAFFPVALLFFILEFCHVSMKKWIRVSMLSFHACLFLIVATNEFHHLYYSSITYTNSGFFAHNIFGHGPFYWLFQATPIIYTVISLAVAFKTLAIMKSSLVRKQFKFIIGANFVALAGLLIFFSGKTQGIDTANLGLAIASILMLIPIFRYSLTDTAVVAKQVIIDSLRDGILVIDSYSNIALINDVAKQIFPTIDVSSRGSYLGIVNDLRLKAENGERIEINSKFYSLINKTINNSEGEYKGELFILDDITESVYRTLEIELQRDRADKANETKIQFISDLSQEIRTPMMSIVGIAEILLRGKVDSSQTEYLESIRDSGNDLVEMISDIKDYSKIEVNDLELVEIEYSPGSMLESVRNVYSEKLTMKPIRLSCEIEEGLPSKLLGDGDRIRQVVSKIVSNAVKYTEIGYINIKVSYNSVEEGKIDLIVSVKDSGQGIRNEELKVLFDANKSVDKRKTEKDGVGLGLKLAKELLDLMGGSIEAKSEFGKGSEFTITVPQKIVDSTPTDIDVIKGNSAKERFVAPGASMLLVEDNEINMKVVRELLKPLQIKVDVAENGLVAIKKVSEKHYDIVFMDYMMPVMDGIEATGKIRSMDGEYFKNIPIVALTANSTVSSKNSFLQAGMNDFLSKPVQISEMNEVLLKWLPVKLVEKSLDIFEKKDSENSKAVEIPKAKPVIRKSDELKEINAESQKKEDVNKMALGVIDRTIGIQYFGSDDLYDSILEDFYRLIDEKSTKIEDLLNSGDIKNYTIEVHALKSTAKMIGAMELSEMALEMEMAGKADNVDLIREKNPELLVMYRAYKESLAYFDKAEDTEKVEVSANVFKSDLFEMNVAAKEFDMDKVDEVMSRIKTYKLPGQEAEELLKQLDIVVRDVNLDKIREITVALAKTL